VILPAKEINVLNPSPKNRQYSADYGDEQKFNNSNSEVYIEIGCKIDSVEYLMR